MPRQTSPPEDAGFAELRALQATMARALFRPLTSEDRLQPRWEDGRPTADVVAEFIKPNARLSAIERVEIYARSYWFRVLDCLYDDFPGVRAVIGRRKFHRLSTAFLARHPSESYTLRDLGSRLPEFIRSEPRYVTPFEELAYDTARFEWAQAVAFDTEAKPTVGIDSLLGADPSQLRLSLQPYLVLLELAYPLDDFLIAVHRAEALRTIASNAVAERVARPRIPRIRRPDRQRAFIAVHRVENSLYYKRLTEPAFTILTALQTGHTLAEACAAGAASAPSDLDLPKSLREWFHDWSALGWICGAG